MPWRFRYTSWVRRCASPFGLESVHSWPRCMLESSSDINSLFPESSQTGRPFRPLCDFCGQNDYSSSIDLTKDGTKLATIVTSAIGNLWTANADDPIAPYTGYFRRAVPVSNSRATRWAATGSGERSMDDEQRREPSDEIWSRRRSQIY